MAAQRLAGLAIAPVGKGESVRLWQELRPGTPVVALNAAVEGIAGVARVYPDNAAAVELPMRRLATLGHSCVAFLSAPRGLVADPDRLRHFHRLARELAVQPVVMRSPLTITDVRKAARALMARLLNGDRPDNYGAPVELVERASLRAPEVPVTPVFTQGHRQSRGVGSP